MRVLDVIASHGHLGRKYLRRGRRLVSALCGAARSLGPTIERDPAFPAGTNVEFVRRERDDVFRVWVWERGCGITHACGTGACAVAAAAVAGGLASFDRPLTMRLPGGDLRVTIPSDPRAGVRMCGPARLVFQGNAPPCPTPETIRRRR